MAISALLAPISDDAPSGENLEYEMIFTEMELAAQYGEERQVGDIIEEAEEPDFKELAKAAEAVLKQTHDMRAIVYLAEAVLNTKGLPAFAEAMAVARGYCEQFWDTFHPQLDEDDGDATMRVNAAKGLADKERLVRMLRRTGLTESRIFGKMSLRDNEIATGKIPPPANMKEVPDGISVSGAFQDSPAEVLEANAAAVKQALADVRALDAVFSEKTPGEGPDLDPLINTLRGMDAVFVEYVGGEAAEGGDAGDAAAAGGDAAPAGGGGGAPAPSGGGAVNSPADVTAAIDRIIAYYQRAEPSSPVPILLERAKRLVSADFLTIMEDMAKDGLAEVRRIGGLEDPGGRNSRY